jgi:c-di-GMP-binding flagellar brake protein YcgR
MGEASEHSERRTSVRVEVDLPLTWRLVHFDREEPPRRARAVDISEGGVRLELEDADRLDLGDVIRVEIEARDLTVSRRGLVVSTRAGIHVAFRSNESADAPSVLEALGLWNERRDRLGAS